MNKKLLISLVLFNSMILPAEAPARCSLKRVIGSLCIIAGLGIGLGTTSVINALRKQPEWPCLPANAFLNQTQWGLEGRECACGSAGISVQRQCPAQATAGEMAAAINGALGCSEFCITQSDSVLNCTGRRLRSAAEEGAWYTAEVAKTCGKP